MLTVKCASCKRLLFKYVKLGKGRLWHCWKDRIVEDHTLRDGAEVKCRCGSLIGTDQGKGIKLKPPAFTYSGTTGKP